MLRSGDGLGAWRSDILTLLADAEGIAVPRRSEGVFPLPEPGVEMYLQGTAARQALADGRPLGVACQRYLVGEFREMQSGE